MKCAHCGKNEAAFTCDCLMVDHHVPQTPDQSVTTESLYGSKRAGLCPDCLKKLAWQHRSDLIGQKIYKRAGTLAAIGVIAGIVAVMNDNNPGLRSVLFPVAGAMIGAAILVFIVYNILAPRKLRQTPWKVVGKRDRYLEDLRLGGTVLVPVGEGYYRSLDDFKAVNSDLMTKTLEKLYRELIEIGEWKKALERGVVDPGSLFAPDAGLSNLIERMRNGAN